MGHSYADAWPRFGSVGGLLHLFPLRISALRLLSCTFCHVFYLYSDICPTKYDPSNTSGTMLIVKANVSKVYLFLLFLDINWRSNMVIKDRQQIPQV